MPEDRSEAGNLISGVLEALLALCRALDAKNALSLEEFRAAIEVAFNSPEARANDGVELFLGMLMARLDLLVRHGDG